MTSNLIPTPIVDKNGKPTTVRKRADNAVKNTKRAAALAGSTPSVARPGTKLRQPVPLTQREGEAAWAKFLEGKTNIMGPGTWKAPTNREARLIERIFRDSGMREDFLWDLISQMGKMSPGAKYAGTDHDYNMLLTAEAYVNRYPDEPQTNGYGFSQILHGVVHRRSVKERNPLTPITSQEELDGRAALVRFMLNPPHNSYRKTADFDLFNGDLGRGTIVTVPALADFIRERPEYVDEINDYIKERGDVKNKAAVDTMRAYFDNREEIITPLQHGWL